MRFPSHLLRSGTFRSEPLLAAMAAIAVGMFVGTWVIGPAITHDSAGTPAQTSSAQTSQERTTFQDLVSRPDPMPYRAATPSFDVSALPKYAAPAKEKAQAELGGPIVDDLAVVDTPRTYRSSARSHRNFDRHRVE